ncbi:hypothetical protein PHMEG_00030844 [Phytophthora megakarya]|uniref:Uncharacterized protein n=1 Tax=Phytophthora megakarya TaxID=4795 RepID=A0A225UZP7_9STRA|nr:hypothetical protein PHMEG_00030844 [Phytophthora megakarya]
MHKALGIAGLTAQDHLRIAHRRHKQEIKEKEMAASQERRNRWYNNIPKRPARAPEHIRELQVQHLREKHEWEKKMQLAQKTIRANQLVLRQETQAIIANASGTYVRGSYLLKVANDTTKTQRQPPPNDQMIIAAQ